MASMGASYGSLHIQQKRVINKVKKMEAEKEGNKSLGSTKRGGFIKKIFPASFSAEDCKAKQADFFMS